MLDDRDIKKLISAQKEVFATSKEVEHLIDIVATKEELSGVEGKIDGVVKDIKEIKSLLIDFGNRTINLENEMQYIESSFNIQPLKNKIKL